MNEKAGIWSTIAARLDPIGWRNANSWTALHAVYELAGERRQLADLMELQDPWDVGSSATYTSENRTPRRPRAQVAYFAHSGKTPDRSDWHPLAAHLKATGDRAAGFLAATSAGEFGRAAGVLHDLGKYTPEFQRRLSGAAIAAPHSTAGAQVAMARYPNAVGKMLAFCIAGHHAGLANAANGERSLSLTERLVERVPTLDPYWEHEIEFGAIDPPRIVARSPEHFGFCAAMFVRMVFSALVDADYLDTEAYYADVQDAPVRRGGHPSLTELAGRLEDYLAALTSRAPAGDVNDIRARVLQHVRGLASSRPGMFSLTVPTGGGKTLSSLAFALDHAVRHGLSRVIYVIPFMSIVEQTAAVFRDALASGQGAGTDFVLEHHSAFEEDRLAGRSGSDKLCLAMENWDTPIVVTTAVQFFESLFARRPSRCRKLHNVANSVVILDEAQTLPLRHLRPCVAALDELARNWRTSVVLCTATQPALGVEDFREGFGDVRELAPNPQGLASKLRRTRIKFIGTLDDKTLASRLGANRQVLCIVNTRRHARDLYALLADAEGACHLTTLMCAAHRRERLRDMRASLKEGKPVRLVATSLIEAGVDVDFPQVWRATAGLESIIQAAGRCNREGRAPIGDVFVFEPEESEGHGPPPEVGQFADAARTVMRGHEDPSAPEAIRAYFRELYWTRGDDGLDAKGIMRLLNERGATLDIPFETVARHFRLIETAMVPIIVLNPLGGAQAAKVLDLVGELERVERPGRIARKLQPYAVQIPPFARDKLLAAGAARIVAEERFERQFVVLANADLYAPDVGLSWDDPTFRRSEGLVC